MATEVKILADSLNPYNGKRLTTFYLKYPRIIHNEFMTHRMIARNAKSSRAMSVDQMIKEVDSDPFVPSKWPAKSKTMHNTDWLEGFEAKSADFSWRRAKDFAVESAIQLSGRGVHKQIVNRLLEPFMWIEVIASATEWSNFFELRRSEFAQPEFQELADMMHYLYQGCIPLETGIHIPGPYQDNNITKSNEYYRQLIIANSGSLARVSYGTKGNDFNKDLDLGNRLLENKHLSPLEHIAMPETWSTLDSCVHCDDLYSIDETQWPYDSCIKGWITARWMIENKALYFAE